MRASAFQSVVTDLSLQDLGELTKSGITAMVVVSTAVGMLLASAEGLSWTLWFHTLAGTALVSAGASALNQVVERDRDARMRRTADRPIPGGRIHPDMALLLGVGSATLGLVQLALAVNLFAAVLAAATLVGYVFVYTPLKRASSLATVIGAVPGAVPPMIGWVAVTGRLDIGAWVLFGLLFFWQIPHFLSIAWLYRVDYERGGFRMISIGDPEGLRTARQATLYCAALVPVSLLPAALGLADLVYFLGAVALGMAFLAVSSLFALDRSVENARRLMLASVFYLPAILGVLVLDRILGWG